MEREIYRLIHSTQSSWWYQGRACVIRRVISPFVGYFKDKNIPLLDIGAGDGGMYAFLKTMGPVSALEPDEESRKFLLEKGYENIMRSDKELLNYPKKFFFIGAFDVLEHIQDEKTFLERIRFSLNPQGIFVLTVPAFPFLWSNHDVLNHHFRRYTKKSIVSVLEKAGFYVEYTSYWNFFFFFPAAIVRFLGFTGQKGLTLPDPLNKIALWLVRTESLLLPRAFLPFGTGIVVVARKKTA